jgi:putative membrane protein
MRRYLKLFFTGLVMGIADLVPGVSGGTIAFIAGIYQELLGVIKAWTGEVIKRLAARRWGEAYRRLSLGFILPLGLGIGTALFGLSPLFAWLWRDYPVFLRAFFFGLILASTVIVLRRVRRWDWWDGLTFCLAAVAAFLLVGLIPLATPEAAWFIFLSGALALSAMALPGISGSFILLLLGKYQFMLEAAAGRDWVILGIFGLGGLVGLALFARALLWLFKHHHDISIVILAGLMLGASRKIWPWQTIEALGNELPRLPMAGEALLIPALLALAGALVVYYLDKKRAEMV